MPSINNICYKDPCLPTPKHISGLLCEFCGESYNDSVYDKLTMNPFSSPEREEVGQFLTDIFV